MGKRGGGDRRTEYRPPALLLAMRAVADGLVRKEYPILGACRKMLAEDGAGFLRLMGELECEYLRVRAVYEGSKQVVVRGLRKEVERLEKRAGKDKKGKGRERSDSGDDLRDFLGVS